MGAKIVSWTFSHVFTTIVLTDFSLNKDCKHLLYSWSSHAIIKSSHFIFCCYCNLFMSSAILPQILLLVSSKICKGSGWYIRELKKLQQLLNRKHHFKIELCTRLSVLWLFHVGHVQNMQSVLSLSWHKWFSCKGRGWKIYCCWLMLS